MEKQKLSRKEYGTLIDEVLHCQIALAKYHDSYFVNALARLIDARIKLACSTVEKTAIFKGGKRDKGQAEL